MQNKYINYQTVLEKKFSFFEWTIGDPENYDTFVWNSDPSLKPSKEFLDSKINAAKQDYVRHRKMHYPSIEDQLDTLYHGGYDAWRASIEAVKTTFPKP